MVFMLIAGIILLCAIIYTLAKSQNSPEGQPPAATTQAPQAPRESTAPTPSKTQPPNKARRSQTFTLRIRNDQSVDGIQTVTASKGFIIQFRFVSDADTEFHIHGYNQEIPAQAGKPREFALTASLEGVFEIEEHHQEILVASLRVTPAPESAAP